MQKIKIYLTLLVFLLVLSIIALVWVANTFAPDSSGVIVLVYSLIAVFGFTTATIFGFYIRRLIGQREFLNSYISTASRQGIWFSLILVISFFLLHQQWFTWLNAVFLVLAFVFFESFLLMKDKNND